MKLKNVLTVVLIVAISLCAAVAQAKVYVVAATPDLADIAKAVGGPNVSVISLMSGSQNPHTVEPRPSQVARLSRADLVVRIGMDLDTWADSLIEASRNRKIQRGNDGYVDASVGIKKLEVPTGRVDGSKGDIHVFGNPHYWLDPINAKAVARNVLAGLKRVDPKGAEQYEKNYKAFVDRIDNQMEGWQKAMAPHKGRKLVAYHKTWAYFLRRFGLREVGTVESKPGIPPSPSYLSSLVAKMKAEKANVILMENFYSRKFPDAIARQTGARVVEVPVSVGGEKGVDNYFELIDRIVKGLSSAF